MPRPLRHETAAGGSPRLCTRPATPQARGPGIKSACGTCARMGTVNVTPRRVSGSPGGIVLPPYGKLPEQTRAARLRRQGGRAGAGGASPPCIGAGRPAPDERRMEMSHVVDLTGMDFGYLHVIGRDTSKKETRHNRRRKKFGRGPQRAGSGICYNPLCPTRNNYRGAWSCTECRFCPERKFARQSRREIITI